MKKLTEQSKLNSPQEYDEIFKLRQKKGVDEHDLRRWKMLLKHYRGRSLIDLGCLDSLVPAMAKHKYPLAHVWGVDVASKALAYMAVDHPDIHWVWQDIQSTTFDYGAFDYAVLGEVLEHCEHPKNIIKEAMRILKPGGVLAISVPLDEAKEPGAVDGHRHIWSFDKQDMRELLEPYGKVKMETVGSLFTWKPPFYRYCWTSLVAFCWKI